jgi:copper chaperone CopZ
MTLPRPRALVRLTIAGMTSIHANRAIFTALAGVEGVVRAEVERGRAIVEHDGATTVEALRQAIALAGYEVTAVEEERRVLPVL